MSEKYNLKELRDIATSVSLPNRSKYKTKQELYDALKDAGHLKKTQKSESRVVSPVSSPTKVRSPPKSPVSKKDTVTLAGLKRMIKSDIIALLDSLVKDHGAKMSMKRDELIELAKKRLLPLSPKARTPSPARKAPSPAKKAPSRTKKSPSPARKAPSPAKKAPSRTKKSPSPARKAPSPAKATKSLSAMTIPQLKTLFENQRGVKIGALKKAEIVDLLENEMCDPLNNSFCSDANQFCNVKYKTCVKDKEEKLVEIVINGHKIIGSASVIKEIQSKIKAPSPKARTPSPVKKAPSPKARTPSPVKKSPSPKARTPSPSPAKKSPSPAKKPKFLKPIKKSKVSSPVRQAPITSPAKKKAARARTPSPARDKPTGKVHAVEDVLENITRREPTTQEYRENLERLKKCLGLMA